MGEKGYRVTGVDYNELLHAFAKILVPGSHCLYRIYASLREILKEFQAAFDAVTIIEGQ